MRFMVVPKPVPKRQNREWLFTAAFTLIVAASSLTVAAKSISSEIMRYDAAAEVAQLQIDTVKEVYLPVEQDDISFPDRMRNQTEEKARKRRRRRNNDDVESHSQHHHHHHGHHQHHHQHNRWRRTPAVWGEPAPDYSSANLSGAVTFLYALLFVDLKISDHYRRDHEQVKAEVMRLAREANRYFYQIDLRLIVVDVIATMRDDLSLYTFEAYRNQRIRELPYHNFAALISYRYAGGLAFVSGMCSSKSVMLAGFYPHNPEAMGSIFFHEVAHLIGVPHTPVNHTLSVPNCACVASGRSSDTSSHAADDTLSRDGTTPLPRPRQIHNLPAVDGNGGPPLPRRVPKTADGCLRIPGFDHDCTLQLMANLVYRNRCLSKALRQRLTPRPTDFFDAVEEEDEGSLAEEEMADDFGAPLPLCGNGVTESGEQCDCGVECRCRAWNCDAATCTRPIALWIIYTSLTVVVAAVLCPFAAYAHFRRRQPRTSSSAHHRFYKNYEIGTSAAAGKRWHHLQRCLPSTTLNTFGMTVADGRRRLFSTRYFSATTLSKDEKGRREGKTADYEPLRRPSATWLTHLLTFLKSVRHFGGRPTASRSASSSTATVTSLLDTIDSGPTPTCTTTGYCSGSSATGLVGTIRRPQIRPPPPPASAALKTMSLPLNDGARQVISPLIPVTASTLNLRDCGSPTPSSTASESLRRPRLPPPPRPARPPSIHFASVISSTLPSVTTTAVVRPQLPPPPLPPPQHTKPRFVNNMVGKPQSPSLMDEISAAISRLSVNETSMALSAITEEAGGSGRVEASGQNRAPREQTNCSNKAVDEEDDEDQYSISHKFADFDDDFDEFESDFDDGFTADD